MNEHRINYTFRINLKNPQHVRINKVLQSLGRENKNKNQFIADALEFYIKHLDGREQKDTEAPVIPGEQLEKLKEEIRQEARAEVMRLIGGFMAGIGGASLTAPAKPLAAGPEKEEGEIPSDETMEQLVADWM